ncbi:hypothetical protein XACW160_20096 [Xanthomonas citri pv. citri]|uniref:Uncharacterized protein n=1 Tax=Xanthomonas citri pv. citri TaxID=611301 RepID=A0A0U5FB28_XANCI|nr:hypothetical protein XAC9322_10106 [Xanthomonas citri pv. citri]CEE16328.1 hypothetical protein XAC1083_10106 [Xanthomonas citri pv. citri]CEE31097.1 hypothetical protein XAC908_20106 [Xanthomonas citri pv. citri]CEE57643.1 hypothetical protein XACW160_20096 [Xanthomonas citri pv. citri]CEE61088.1 hypothetical protein XAC2852_20088 [Xanthomonas citri pv. citri]
MADAGNHSRTIHITLGSCYLANLVELWETPSRAFGDTQAKILLNFF